MSTIYPTLLIGLGGTGIKSLVHTKKMFIEAYGEVPPTIAFLGIDTDMLEQRYSIDGVALDESEYCSLYVSKQNALAIYNIHRDRLSWIPKENSYIFRGVNMAPTKCRTAGRFAFCVNRDLIVESVNRKLFEIKSAFSKDCYPEINVVSSLCGGTGAGMLIDMGYLLRQVAQKSEIHCYAVGPEVFNVVGLGGFDSVFGLGVQHCSPNSFATLVDLDYLMSMTYGNEPVKLEYLREGDSIETNDRPYDSVYFINNSNSKLIVSHIDSLAQMIGIALFAKSGDMGGYIRSYDDGHTDICADQGLFDVENKHAWVRGIGACEIIYSGEKLAKIYAMKAAQQLITRLTKECVLCTDVIVDQWVDYVKIRENDVVNFIADATSQIPFYLNDKKTVRTEVETSMVFNKLNEENISAKIDELVARVRAELRILLVEYINSNGGVAIANSILGIIKTQMQLRLGMISNKVYFMQNDLSAIKSNIESLITKIEKSWFIRKSVREELSDVMQSYNTSTRDIQCHNGAIAAYESILATIDECLEKVCSIESLLQSVSEGLADKIAKAKGNLANNNNFFQIDLAKEYLWHTDNINGDEIIIGDFVKTLDGELKLYGLNEFSSPEVEAMLLNYTATLSGVEAYANCSVEDILREIAYRGDNGFEEFNQIIKWAIERSSPYMGIDYKGYNVPEYQPIEYTYVGVYDSNNTILVDNDNFRLQLRQCDGCQFVSTGIKGKIVVLQQIGYVPAYAISGIDNWQRQCEYYNSSCRFHFDANIKRRMEDEYYSIYPTPKPKPVRLCTTWVLGFIYGLIKNENGCYYMKSESLGCESTGFWVKLASRRDEAFDEFMTHDIHFTRDIYAHIDAENTRMGEESIRQLIADAKGNYIDGYSQLNISNQTLRMRGYERIVQLIIAECECVKDL